MLLYTLDRNNALMSKKCLNVLKWILKSNTQSGGSPPYSAACQNVLFEEESDLLCISNMYSLTLADHFNTVCRLIGLRHVCL